MEKYSTQRKNNDTQEIINKITTTSDLIDKEIEEIEQLGMRLNKIKETMPEKEYNKMFHNELMIIHKKYKKLIKKAHKQNQ